MTSRFIKLASLSAALVVVVLVSGFAFWSRSPVNLGGANAEDRAQLLRQWQAGEVVALVRHAERCDRSSNPCFGPADGITKVGNQAAIAVGQGFTRLGMEQTDVISSPATRTAQTAHAMFSKDAIAQDWLASCGKPLRNDVVAHKRAHHNLVLVTHSGCISDFEAQTGYPHAATSEYGSSLLVHIDEKGELKILGIVKADDWKSLLQGSSAQ
ncbi:phosphohistidine phosphatase SixA [Pseudomonas sp. JAI111]|uniref:lipopolysaccharide core heptose(II)-phosphate phosphatase PmrG n=1 Tax=Pseudomonas sp. JAI111 TaxID=2735913 RepID=UPI0021692EA7|nr:histidine phosphatase family protein [Pseudomonas sp. JAI111]MCS3838916.1 phosphohistidine phosphatase SixA [Pseudomonas sp. JAI111]